MFGKRVKFLVLALVFLMIGVVLINGPIAAQSPEKQPEKLKEIALELVAARNNLPISTLEVINSAKTDYILLSKMGFHYKVADKSSGELYGITLDENGKELEHEQLLASEQAAYTARYGKLEQALAEQLSKDSTGKPIKVIIWLKEQSYAGPERPALEDSNAVPAEEQTKILEDFYEKADAQRAAAVERVVAPVVERLKKQGNEVMTSTSAPIIIASLTSKKIKEIANWDEVDMVYQDIINEPALNIARPTILANTVWNRNIAGFGVKVGEVEVGGQINTTNPYLGPPSIYQDSLYSCLSPHATAVAGIIRSWHPTYFGTAPGVWLWIGGSCNGFFSQLQSRETAATDWGARVLTNSWGAVSADGMLTVQDRFFDSFPINRDRTVIFAAGNRGTADGWVTSPATSYNTIAVGASDDKNTLTWSDDIVASYSSWRDPISAHGDREKPEVMAPGTNFISTTDSFPWTGSVGSGTSYATPMVAGEAALLMQRWPFLQSWPETLKAIVMATAVHNIEGSTRLSEFDGAGEIVADRADDVARKINGNAGGISYSCSTPSPLTLTTMLLTTNVKTRAVIAWDTDPAYVNYFTQPNADLDLRIYNPSGVLVASSTSFDNTYEIVDFTPDVSGTYTMRVTKSRCDLSPRSLGWGWGKGG